MHSVFLGLGSNLGDRQQQVLKAMEKIEQLVGRVVARSSLYETEPWGFLSTNRFVNAVIKVQTSLSPRELLSVTQQIERAMGRKEKSLGHQYADRPIDIDILLYDDLLVDEPDLKIPHPLMQERDFVMRPLNEILNNDNC